jgi:hypothetical protein
VIADPVYFQTLDTIAAPYVNASASFPKAKRAAVIDAVDSVKERSFDAGAAVDQIRIMRNDADTAYHQGEKGLGNAYRGIAKAMEDQLDRHLQASGLPPDILTDFKQARKTIAQTYSVQDALRPSGNVDAKVLGRQLDKRPLTGNLKIVAEFGANFPKAAQVPERIGGVPMSPLDMAFSLGKLTSAGAGGVVATGGNPLGVVAGLLPFTRPAVRSMLASQPFQKAMVTPSYQKSLLARILNTQEQLPVTMTETTSGQRK